MTAPLRRFAQVDEAERGSTWNILLPGPSLERSIAQGGVDERYPTIAVHGAILAPVPIFYWCSWAGPRDRPFPSWLSILRQKSPRIISGPKGGKWADRVPRAPHVVVQCRSDSLPAPWRRARCNLGPSWLLAVRFAVERAQACSIRFYGLDLEGEGYAYDLPDPRQRSAEDWEGRWIGERRILDRLAALTVEEDWSYCRIACPKEAPEINQE